MSNDPVRRFTLLLLLQAQKDKATELVIAPAARDGAPVIKYKAGENWYALAPPPPDILPEVVAELGRLACLSQGVFPTRGTIDVAFSGVRLQWEFVMARAGSECVLTPLTPL
jgi:hypothetical protein